jgi:glycosyltransferase involved in cell wall biosynthesis
MEPISVLIPTANRPAMLRTALRSVAGQTALSSIAEVVVIENLGNRESGNICKEFPQLPVHYVFRDPPIPPGIVATRDALSRIRCERMAILFDDDWWMERHLENAIEAFSIYPNAIASFAACLWTTGEEGYLTEAYGSFLPWFAATKPPMNHRWLLELADLLVAGIISTGFHYSSLVVNRDVFVKSIECTADGNPYDTDRLISVELGRHGKVACHCLPQVYIRMHKGREAFRLTTDDTGARWWNASTERLFALAESEHIDLKQEFECRMKAKGVGIDELRRFFGHGSFNASLKRGILEPGTNERYSVIRAIYREITPPALQNAVKWLRLLSR